MLSQDLQLASQGYDEVVFEGVEGYKIQLLLGYVLSACFVGVKYIARSYPMGPTLLISHCSLKTGEPFTVADPLVAGSIQRLALINKVFLRI